MKNYRLKIKKLSDAKKEIEDLKRLGKKIIFTNGCFDILHIGHARYLRQAKNLGDVLVVGINSDSSVRCLGKDKNRPINNELDRSNLLANLECVDFVVIFDESTPINLMARLKPGI